MNRKPFFVIALLLASTLSCKKKIEEIKKDLLVDFVSSHDWKIVDFQNTDTVTHIVTFTTDAYTDYVFDFHDNSTVDVLKAGAIVTSGTWTGHFGTKLSDSQIIADFPSATDAAISKISGTWQTTNSNLEPAYFRAKRYEGVNEFWFKMQAVN